MIVVSLLASTHARIIIGGTRRVPRDERTVVKCTADTALESDGV